MRRKLGTMIGVCAALALTGTTGALVMVNRDGDTGRSIGTWHEGSPVADPARLPGSAQLSDPAQLSEPGEVSGDRASDPVVRVPGAPAGQDADVARPSEAAEPAGTVTSPSAAEERAVLPESAAADGRQRVGQLLRTSKLLGYAGAPSREKFSYPGASYVKVHFRRMVLLPGDYVTVSDGAGKEAYRYDRSSTGPRWAMSVNGDTAVVEVHRADPAAPVTGRIGVDVDRVARGFTRTEQGRAPQGQAVRPGRSGREESICGNDTSVDAVCYKSADPVAYTKSKAVARLLINGTELCTGWRVGANNRMLTNNHCFATSQDAYETEVWFNYQCTRCGGFEVLKPTKVWGDRVLATNKTYDYTLFTVENFATVQKFGYLQLDTVRPAKGQPLYVPQHPAGEPTRISGAKGESAGNCSVSSPGYTGYAANTDVSYYCDTAGGSSGSPVISRKTNKVVALHHFGGCPNSGVRGDVLASKLKSLL